jgi:3-hydroxyisobutyrate dehydrogenase-like beta-hydroxyacid dehydrogenase
MRIGFAGLGVPGRPLARQRPVAGHARQPHRIEPASSELADAGGVPVNGPAEAAAGAEAVTGRCASSKVLALHGERMVRGAFEPGFRLRRHRKDLSLEVDAARALDVALPSTVAVPRMMNAAVAHGDGDRGVVCDHSALIRTMEALGAPSG